MIWVKELLTSFLLYILIFGVTVALLGGILLYLKGWKIARILIWAGSALGLVVLCYQVSLIPRISYAKHQPKQSKQFLRVGFYNKHYLNQDFESIRQRLVDNRLDLLAIAEVTTKQFSGFEQAFDQYYLTKFDCSCQSDNFILISKQPVEVKSFDMLAKGFEVETELGDQVLSLQISHFLYPGNSKMLVSRNQAIAKVVDQVSDKHSWLWMGDFNLSPFASSYQTTGLGLLKNINSNLGLGHSWCYQDKIAPCTTIDYGLIDDNLKLYDYQTVDGGGSSDHQMIIAEVGI